ncbi:hypothetical protein G9C98_007688 [Cotesia typhae]|uniref:C2H2-type domain-containing protein n=1 Tax=Cotesia typhae TaxID=2053667 RepID=A0A8J5QVS4_9HYME|nr:hypothetical protein G9C98_007688 [Cotesia typhae]
MLDKMCAQLFSCPLCARPSFESLDSLRIGLVSVATRPLQCPVCSETLLGIDKLTIHLFGHTINTPEGTTKLIHDNQTKAITNTDFLYDNSVDKNQNQNVNYQGDCGLKIDLEQSTRTENCLGKIVNSCVIQSKDVATVSINSLHQREPRQLPSAWSNDLSLHGIQNPTSTIKLSNIVDVKSFHMIDEKDIDIKPEALLKNYPCHLCHKIFKMRGSLMVHMRVAHTGINLGSLSKDKDSSQGCCENGFNCPTCGKNFRKEQHVTQHLKTHEAKQWECDVCSKMFTTKYFLKKHKRLHSGEMPYKCNICNKTFTFQQSYHKHRLYHKDDKPHTCTTCGRSFKELSTLHNHERIHTGEKPFACETCVQTAEAKESLSDHSENSSGGNEVTTEIDNNKNLGISEVNQENKFVLVVDNGQPILKREQEINSTLSQECNPLLHESLQINDPDDFYPFVAISPDLRPDLSSPSTEMKQLRLSSPTNEDSYQHQKLDEPFQEAPDLHKDIKHAIDGILQERREINALETINDESFKQLLYEIDKKI